MCVCVEGGGGGMQGKGHDGAEMKGQHLAGFLLQEGRLLGRSSCEDRTG